MTDGWTLTSRDSPPALNWMEPQYCKRGARSTGQTFPAVRCTSRKATRDMVARGKETVKDSVEWLVVVSSQRAAKMDWGRFSNYRRGFCWMRCCVGSAECRDIWIFILLPGVGEGQKEAARCARQQGPDAELLKPSSKQYVILRANIYSTLHIFSP